jgi:hypothetical protein
MLSSALTLLPACRIRPRTAAGGGRPQVGLEVVEKLLTNKAGNGLPVQDAGVAFRSVLSRLGTLGKQGKVVLEGSGQAFQESASLVSRCERRAAGDAGLGVAAHARHQQVWPRVGLPVAAPVSVVYQLRIAVQEQRDLQLPFGTASRLGWRTPASRRGSSMS